MQENTLHPSTALSKASRRRAMSAVVSLSVLALVQLAGCATPPPPETRAEKIQKALRSLGFSETAEGWELNLSGKILFDTDSSELGAAGGTELSRIGPVLVNLDIKRLKVEGHTDNVGSDAYNLDLSLRRAQAVSRALVAQGVPSQGVTVRGFGKDRPVADNATAEGRQENRRVAIIVPAPLE